MKISSNLFTSNTFLGDRIRYMVLILGKVNREQNHGEN